MPALESLSSLGFEERNLGCPGNFAGMSRTLGGVQKVSAKKLRAHFSFPIDIMPQLPPEWPKAEKIENFHPQGPEAQNHVSEAIVANWSKLNKRIPTECQPSEVI